MLEYNLYQHCTMLEACFVILLPFKWCSTAAEHPVNNVEEWLRGHRHGSGFITKVRSS